MVFWQSIRIGRYRRNVCRLNLVLFGNADQSNYCNNRHCVCIFSNQRSDKTESYLPPLWLAHLMWNTRLLFGEYVLEMSSLKRKVDVAEFFLFISYFLLVRGLPNKSSPVAVSRVLTWAKAQWLSWGTNSRGWNASFGSSHSRWAVSKWKQP